MKQPQVLPIESDLVVGSVDRSQKELRLGRFSVRYRIMTVFLHPRG
jgi:hypothetical protein